MARTGLRVRRSALREEVLGKQRDVPRPLAQRRDPHRHHRQPVEQIAPEGPPLHLGLEILVRGRDEAHVDLHRPVGPDRGHPLLLDRAQELGLERERHLADLVEEERPAVGHLEEAAPVSVAPVKAPLRKPNSSDSNSSSGMAAQLTATKGRSRRAPEKWIERASSSLPTPGLAVDEDGGVEVGHRPQQLEHLTHGGALGHDVSKREPLLVPPDGGAVGRPQLLELDGPPDDQEQLAPSRTA